MEMHLQETGELGVPEGDVGCVAIRQLADDAAEGEEGFVDEGALPRLPFVDRHLRHSPHMCQVQQLEHEIWKYCQSTADSFAHASAAKSAEGRGATTSRVLKHLALS